VVAAGAVVVSGREERSRREGKEDAKDTSIHRRKYLSGLLLLDFLLLNLLLLKLLLLYLLLLLKLLLLFLSQTTTTGGGVKTKIVSG
jgi:hypothetical protein